MKQEKLKMWKKQLEELEKKFQDTLLKKGEAAREGDLSENAAYKDAVETSEMLSAQIGTVQKMVKQLEEELK